MNRKINASRERKKICSRVSARVKTQSLSVSRPNKWLSKTAQWNEAFHSPDVWNYFTIKRCQSRWRTLNAGLSALKASTDARACRRWWLTDCNPNQPADLKTNVASGANFVTATLQSRRESHDKNHSLKKGTATRPTAPDGDKWLELICRRRWKMVSDINN